MARPDEPQTSVSKVVGWNGALCYVILYMSHSLKEVAYKIGGV